MSLFYSVVVVFSKDKKKILLGKRREDKKWTSPAGGGEAGETPEDAAIRELFEEANITCKKSDLRHLTTLKAGNDKPIFIYLIQLSGKQDIHVKNDPDKEVPSWQWFPLNKMPSLDRNRQESINLAKMKMMKLVKSIVSNDMFTGTDLITQNYSQDEMAAKNTNIFDDLTLFTSGMPTSSPQDYAIGSHSMVIEKIGEGLYSGSVKNSENERVMNFAELSVASLVQALKAKQIVGDEHVLSTEEPKEEPKAGLSDVIQALKDVQVQGDLNIHINKSVKDFVKLLRKGRTAVVGEIRTWSNGRYMKHADGWVRIGGEHHGKLMGKFKGKATHTEVADAEHDPSQDDDITTSDAQGIEQAKEIRSKAAKEKELEAKKEELKAKIAKLEAEIKEMKGTNAEKEEGTEKKPKDSKEGKGPDQKEAETGSPEESGGDKGTGDGSSEGSEGVSGEYEEENPREEAAKLLESENEYINARKSTVTNLGADLLDSARHKAAWRTAAEAEATGQAKKIVMRAKMLKEDPISFETAAPNESDKAHKAAVLYQAMQSFPTGPDYKLFSSSGYQNRMNRYNNDWVALSEEERKEKYTNRGLKPTQVDIQDEAALRKEYIETFNKVKDKIVELAQDPELDSEQAVKVLERFVGLELAELRKDDSGASRGYGGGGRVSTMAEQLVGFHNNILGRGASSAKMKAATLLKEKDALISKPNPKGDHWVKLHTVDPAKAEEIHNQVQAGMAKGKNLKSSLELKGTGPDRKKYKINGPAQFYVVDRAERKGPDTKLSNMTDAQKSLTPDGEFGMRGVQYGNSVTDEERVHHTTRLAESLQDLTDILGIPSEMASFNGRLGMAIGARGIGNAMAHYEPDMKVINLTRKNGVGTLAHEWGHFMDDILGSLNTKSGFLSDVSTRGSKEDMTKSASAMADFKESAAWSEFKNNVIDYTNKAVSAGHMNPVKRRYWSSDIECFARAFEAHVQHKLESAGRENTYLSAAPKEGKLWPDTDMRAKLAPAFDKLMAEIKASGDLKKALLILKFESLNKGKALPVGTVREYDNGQKMRKMANGKWETISSKSEGKEEAPKEEPKAEEPKKEAPKAESGLTDEQKHNREKSPNYFKRLQNLHEEIGNMTQKEYIAATKAEAAKSIKERYPEATDQQIKDAITRARVTKSAKDKFKAVAEQGPKYGLMPKEGMQQEAQVKEKKKAAKEEDAKGIVESNLNKETNLIKSVDFSKTSKKNAAVLMRHLEDSNKIIKSMGITLKTPLDFKCSKLGNGTNRTRAVYQRSRSGKSVILKDKSAANKSVMHEIGHGIDDALRSSGGFRSEEINSMEGQLKQDFQELTDLVTNSKYYTEADKSFAKYLKEPTEVFARGFEVYSLVKAEELQAKGEISKDFLESFVPDIFKENDETLSKLRAERNALMDDYHKAPSKEEKAKVVEKMREISPQISSRVKELGGAYVNVSEDQQKEYKAKISALMERIFASDTIKKALRLMELAQSLKEKTNS